MGHILRPASEKTFNIADALAGVPRCLLTLETAVEELCRDFGDDRRRAHVRSLARSLSAGCPDCGFHASSATGMNLPDQVSDNTPALDSQYAALRLEADRIAVGTSPGSVRFSHRLTNLGNGADTFDLSLRSPLGYRVSLYSDPDGAFTRAYVSAEDADVPGLTVFARRDGVIRHFWSGEMSGEMADPGQDPRGSPEMDPLWLLLDATPGGRGRDWYPKLAYG